MRKTMTDGHMTLIFDAHLDLSMNALEWNRDLTRPLDEVRQREQGQTDRRDRGQGVVAFPEMRRGRVGLCIATLIARYVEPGNPLPGWHSPDIAWAVTQGQLAWYQAMQRCGEMIPITDSSSLRHAVELWNSDASNDRRKPIGYVLSMEGADSIRSPDDLLSAYKQGLRAIGPAHYGPGRYAPGTSADGGLTDLGRQLLREMRQLGVVLDVTHLTDEAFWQSLEMFDGPVWASHNNCRTLVPNERQFSDHQLEALFQRDAVIGVALDAWMLSPNWVKGQTRPEQAGVTLEHVVDQIDHICQLAGNTRHCGIGSDLDGGYGREQCPTDVNSIADLQKLDGRLKGRGYSSGDVTAILHGNWLRRLQQIWEP